MDRSEGAALASAAAAAAAQATAAGGARDATRDAASSGAVARGTGEGLASADETLRWTSDPPPGDAEWSAAATGWEPIPTLIRAVEAGALPDHDEVQRLAYALLLARFPHLAPRVPTLAAPNGPATAPETFDPLDEEADLSVGTRQRLLDWCRYLVAAAAPDAPILDEIYRQVEIGWLDARRASWVGPFAVPPATYAAYVEWAAHACDCRQTTYEARETTHGMRYRVCCPCGAALELLGASCGAPGAA